MRKFPWTAAATALGATALLALAGCAGSMNAKECQSADWRAIGFEDGAKGRDAAYIGNRRKACGEHGVAIDFAAWQGGRAEGLAQFCRPLTGYRLGSRGYAYRGVCPPDLEPSFLSAHADGYGLYERRLAVQRLRKELNRTRKQLADTEHGIADATALLVTPRVSPQQRADTAVTLKQLVTDRVRLEDSIPLIEEDLARAEHDYESYRRRFSTAYR